MDEDISTLGKRIKYARDAAELTQQQLADKIGVTKSTISQWENDDIKNLRMSNLFALEDATGISARWISEKTGQRKVASPGGRHLSEEAVAIAEKIEALPGAKRSLLDDFLRHAAPPGERSAQGRSHGHEAPAKPADISGLRSPQKGKGTSTRHSRK